MSDAKVPTGVVHAIGWMLIVVGILMWLTGVWGSPIVFLLGLVVEGVGYFLADRGSSSKK
jgi:uncharacterized membrane protein YiaA